MGPDSSQVAPSRVECVVWQMPPWVKRYAKVGVHPMEDGQGKDCGTGPT